MNKLIIIITILVLLATKSNSQDKAIQPEDIQLNINNNILFPGEKLEFKVYNFNSNNQLSDLSKIAYVNIINDNHKKVLSNKITLINGIGNGNFFIPQNLKSGHYKVIAYTHQSLNQKNKQIAIKDLLIINPFKKLPSNLSFRDSIQNKNPTQKNYYLSIKKSFNTRSSATLEIRNINSEELNRFHLYIKKIDSIDYKLTSEKDDENYTLNTNNKFYLPEIRGEVLSGNISSSGANSVNLKNQFISLSIPGEASSFFVNKTNENGQFYFTIPKSNSGNLVYLQLLGNKKENYKIKTDSIQLSLNQLHFSDSIYIANTANKFIKERMIALQIENAYFQTKQDTTYAIKKQVTPFYQGLETVYNLDDYERFSTIEKTIIEVINEMTLSKKNGDKYISLRDYENDLNKENYDQTLILVDGVQLGNINNLLSYDAINIDRIELVNRGYIYGGKIFNGIVNFITKEKNYNYDTSANFILTSEFNRPQIIKKSLKIDYSKNKSELDRIPDYRYQLVWLPKIDKKKIQFSTSDITGWFEAVIEGYTQQGELIKESIQFEVVK